MRTASLISRRRISAITPAFVAGSLLACAAAPKSVSPPPARPGRTEAAIRAEDLRRRLSIIADDSTEGRASGSLGFLRAEAYVVSELRRLGVQPAGDSGGYTQPIRSIVRGIGHASLGVAGTQLQLWRDFVPMPWPWIPNTVQGAVVVFGGELGGTAIRPEDAAGKFVILLRPSGRSVMPRVGPGDDLRLAAAVAVVGLENFTEARLAPIRRGLVAGLDGDPIFAQRSPLSLIMTTAAAEKLLGKKLADARIGDIGGRIDGSITISDSVASVCCNVVGVIQGSDPRLRTEYVALGSHLDHLGIAPAPVDHDSAHVANALTWDLRGRKPSDGPPADVSANVHVNVDSLRHLRPARRDSIFNGADDNGSGTVAMLELAEAIAARRVKPKRSTLLVWHAGEELGDQGSRWFTDHPTVPLDSIVAELNLDMIGRGSATDFAGGGPRYLQVIGSRRLSPELGDLITRVNSQRRVPFEIDYQFDAPGDPQSYYCRSDHYEYARHGIPIAFFTTGEHGDYHQVTDEAQYIDYSHLASITEFVLDVVSAVSDLPSRPVLSVPTAGLHSGC